MAPPRTLVTAALLTLIVVPPTFAAGFANLMPSEADVSIAARQTGPIALEPGPDQSVNLATSNATVGLGPLADATCSACIVKFLEAADCNEESGPWLDRCVGDSVGCVNVNSESGGPLPHGFRCIQVGVCTCQIQLWENGCADKDIAWVIGAPGQATKSGPYRTPREGYGYAIAC